MFSILFLPFPGDFYGCTVSDRLACGFGRFDDSIPDGEDYGVLKYGGGKVDFPDKVNWGDVMAVSGKSNFRRTNWSKAGQFVQDRDKHTHTPN